MKASKKEKIVYESIVINTDKFITITNRFDKFLPEIDISNVKNTFKVTFTYYEAEILIGVLKKFIKTKKI